MIILVQCNHCKNIIHLQDENAAICRCSGVIGARIGEDRYGYTGDGLVIKFDDDQFKDPQEDDVVLGEFSKEKTIRIDEHSRVYN